MTEPLTKEERELARSYAETVYADTTDPQKHTAAVMILRLLDTVAALEAELVRLRPLAESGEAVSNLPPRFFIGNGLYGDKEWVVICENEEDGRLFPRINANDAAEALRIVDELAALRAAKGEGHD